ncbi:MAG TPA: ABC transporter permease [Gemmatimonadaceae bacterium]
MSFVDGLRYRVRALFGARRHAREAERELRFHLDLEAAQRVHGGDTPEDAEFAARRQLGNRTAVAEGMRSVAGLAWLDATRQDLAFALRGIRRAPAFSLVAAATLALGIGAATTIYAVVDAVLIRPLPITNADRVLDLEIVRQDSSGRRDMLFVSAPEYLRWRKNLRSFSEIAAATPMRSVSLGRRTQAWQPWLPAAHVVHMTEVTPNFFGMVGTSPAIGHGFGPIDDGDVGPKTAVLSYGYWQSAYGGDPRAMGRTIVLDDDTYTIAGVMPPRFVFPEDTQIWTSAGPDIAAFRTNEYTFMLDVIGRLRVGVSPDHALAELRTLYAADTVGVRSLSDLRVDAAPIRETIVQQVATHLMIMMACVAVLLLIASANVTNMLLVRGAARRHEIAVRLALGSGRGRIVRQLVTEALMLAALGALAGLVAAAFLVQFVAGESRLNLPRHSLVALDPPVLFVSAIAAAVVGIVCGIIPALSVSRDALETTLRSETARNSAGRRRRRLRNALAVGQVAMSVVLLAGAGLLVQTVRHLMELRPGVTADGVDIGDIDPGFPAKDTVARVLAARRIQERLAALPNVAEASVSTTYPFGGALSLRDLRIPGHARQDSAKDFTLFAGVDRHYFTALQIRVVRGRAFIEGDLVRRDVAIVNETMAKRYFGTLDPIGRHITLAQYPVPLEIVGVVDATRVTTAGSVGEPATYVPVGAAGAQNLSMIVRVAHGNPSAMTPAIQHAVEQAAPGAHAYYVAPLNALMGYLVGTEHTYTMILVGFALAALLVTAVGLYGVISYSVAQRTSEIGIRIALGASPNRVRRRVAGQGLGLTLTGVGVGAAAAILATRILRSMLFGVAPGDPTVIALVAILLAAVALLASWLPARRAAAVDPLIAIRTE